MGKKSYPFEKNFLNQVMKQALQIKQQRNLDFVTPIVAFSNAKVLVPPGKIKNVYVVERLRLVPLLRSPRIKFTSDNYYIFGVSRWVLCDSL